MKKIRNLAMIIILIVVLLSTVGCNLLFPPPKPQLREIITSPNSEDWFGTEILRHDNYLFVSAYYDRTVAVSAGAVYVYSKDNNTWSNGTRLTASDGAAGDNFGRSIAVSGNYLAVGAYGDDDIGSTYIFQKQTNGTWTQLQKITPSDGANGDDFGNYVAISGDYLIVGAPYDDDTEESSGSAYVFKRQANGTWNQVQKLNPTDAGNGDNFGYSISIDGEYAVFSASNDNDNGNNSGSAYVFKLQSNGTWTQSQKITAPDADTGHEFSTSLTITGDDLLISSIYGKLYTYRKQSNGNFTHKQTLTPKEPVSGTIPGNLFGFGHAISGDLLMVSAMYEGWDISTNPPSGSVYTFKRKNGTWEEVIKIVPETATRKVGDFFGFSLTFDANTAYIATHNTDSTNPGRISAIEKP